MSDHSRFSHRKTCLLFLELFSPLTSSVKSLCDIFMAQLYNKVVFLTRVAQSIDKSINLYGLDRFPL